MTVTRERVEQLLSYDPLTGLFLWKVRSTASVQWNGRHANKEAGCLSKDSGYRLIYIDGRLYRAHQLAWLFVHGTWPADVMDHANGDRGDNRIDNLREATQSQNSANSWRPHKSTTGFKGVSSSGRKTKPWAAHIKQHGKSQFLGRYDTPEAAHAAYAMKAVELFGEFARLS